MIDTVILSSFERFGAFLRQLLPPHKPQKRDLHTCWRRQTRLPDFVEKSPIAQRYLDLLGPLD